MLSACSDFLPWLTTNAAKRLTEDYYDYRVKRDLVADKDGFRMDRRFLNEPSFGIFNISKPV